MVDSLETHPLRFLKNLRRTGEIAAVLINHGFGDLVERIGLRKYLNWGRRKLLKHSEADTRSLTRGERIRLSLESLGPTFIKFGQVLSTRPDLIPADITEELCKLQEAVPAFNSEEAISTVEKALGASIEELFSDFERSALASGSLGQVHRAVLLDGQPVVVKIRRPRVVQDVERDLALMTELAILIQRHIPESAIFDPLGLVRNFERTIHRELNFQREARSLQEFARLFSRDASLYVPVVYEEMCTQDILVMEYISGYRIDEISQVELLDNQRRQIAINGARLFMKQAFEFGVFHGDPHPGNIRILNDGSICLLDYGMVGTLDEATRNRLVDLFVSIATKDERRGLRTILLLGQPFREVDERLLRSDYRDFIETYYGYSLEKVDVGKLLSDFISILSNHGIRCPADLMLLIRAIVNLEGSARKIDPKFNFAEQMVPYVKRLLHERYKPGYLWERFRNEAEEFGRIAHDVPYEITTLLKKLNRDETSIKLKHTGLDHLITEVDRSSNRIVIGMVISASIVASSLLVKSGAANSWFSIPIYVISSFLGIWLIYGIFRSRRL